MTSIALEFGAYLARLARNGGPTEEQHPHLNAWIEEFDDAWRAGEVSDQERATVLAAFGDAVSLETVQGWVLQKPYGYAGDFEVLERIYGNWLSPRPHLVRWDQFFHAQAASKAVRNRKTYFHSVLQQLTGRSRVLNLGSGSGRCIQEWFDASPDSGIRFDCVDIDDRAIQYAEALNAPFMDKIRFRKANVIRFVPEIEYELIWSGGLFDYFNDRVFVSVVRRLKNFVLPGGEIVIGNFSVGNPSRPYMELGGWHLYHRSREQLIELMGISGLEPGCVDVRTEPEGVNLFVHARPR